MQRKLGDFRRRGVMAVASYCKRMVMVIGLCLLCGAGGCGRKASVAVLARLLFDPSAEEKLRLGAAVMLAERSDDPEAARCLVAAMESEQPRVREAACGGLSYARALRGDSRVIGGLVRCLRDLEAPVRCAAIWSLPELCVAGDQRVMDAVVRCVSDADACVRRGACRALGVLGGDGGLAAATLQRCLIDSDSKVRVIAIDALGRLGPQARPALRELVRCLAEDGESIVRSTAAKTLAKLGTDACEEVAGHLSLAIVDRDFEVQAAAGEALVRLGGDGCEAAQDAVRTILAQGPDAIRIEVVGYIFGLDDGRGEWALDDLDRLAETSSGKLKAAAELAIKSMSWAK